MRNLFKNVSIELIYTLCYELIEEIEISENTIVVYQYKNSILKLVNDPKMINSQVYINQIIGSPAIDPINVKLSKILSDPREEGIHEKVKIKSILIKKSRKSTTI